VNFIAKKYAVLTADTLKRGGRINHSEIFISYVLFLPVYDTTRAITGFSSEASIFRSLTVFE